jgi:hypothetical protein
MKPGALWAAAALLAGCSSSGAIAPPLTASGSVLQHHANPTRDGMYVDPSLTRGSAAGLHPDPTFDAPLPGATFYAQPLYWPGGPGGKDLVIVASEQDVVYALDAATGAVVWQRSLGTPVPLSALPCGNIDPLGVTGTPVIDPGSRTLFVDAMTTPDGGTTKKHLVFALSVDDGSIRSGWPLDVSDKVRFGALAFDSGVQNQRGALAFLNGNVYLAYGGFFGDCGDYHGWLVSIPASNPQAPSAWATSARGGGSWAPSGVASDGTSVFIATGNTFSATTWSGGEAVLRFSSGPALADFFATTDWQALDAGDVDLGGTGPVLLDVPGATPSALAVALGKNGKIYLLDRNHLGSIGGELFSATVAADEIINAAAAYPAASGAFVVFKATGASCPSGQGTGLTAVRIVPSSPPTATPAWCAFQDGMGSPMVTTTDGRSESMIWSVGAEGDGRLRGYDGENGSVLYTSGAIGHVRRYQTPILAAGRIFVAADGAIHAFVR